MYSQCCWLMKDANSMAERKAKGLKAKTWNRPNVLGNKASLKEYLGWGQSMKQGATPKEKDNSQYFELLQKNGMEIS